MTVNIFNVRNKLIKYLTIGSPIIAIGLVYFFGISPLDYLKDVFNEKFFNTIKKDATVFMINQAIIVFIINLFLESYRHFGKFTISIQNKDRQSTTYLPLSNHSQKSRLIDFDIKLDYRMLWAKKFLNSIGGIKLFIYVPHWLSLEIRNKDNFKPDTFDEAKIDYIAVDLNKTIQNKKTSGKIYIEAQLLSGATSFVEDDVICEIKPASENKFFKVIAYILIFMLFDIEEKKHNVVSTRI